MEEVLVDVYSQMLADRDSSVDDILIVDALRSEFVGECRSHLGADAPSDQLLRRLCNLRKRGRLPRRSETGLANLEVGS